MKNNNSHKQPGLRLPLLPAPPGCGGPAPRAALPPTGCTREKGFSCARGEPSGPPFPAAMPRQEENPGPLGRAAGLLEHSQIGELGWKQAEKDTVPQGRAGLGCPSPGAAGQTDTGMSETPRGKPQVRRGGAASVPRGAGSSGARGPLQRPPVRPGPAAPSGPWGRRGGGEGRPRSPSSFLGSSSPLQLKRKRAPRVTELSSFDLTHPRPGHPSSASLPGGAASPLAPFGIPKSPGDPRKTTLLPRRAPVPAGGDGKGPPGAGARLMPFYRHHREECSI